MKLNSLLAVSSAALLATSSAAIADDYDKRWHISAMASFLQSDEDRSSANYAGTEVGEGLGWQLNIGRAVSDALDLDLQLHRSEPRKTNGDDAVDTYGAGLELSYYLAGRNPAFSPLLITGIGFQENEVGDSATGIDVSGFTADLGLGFVSQITEHGTAIKGDIRGRYEVLEDQPNYDREHIDLIVNLGIQLPFGSAADDTANITTDSDDNRWYVSPMLSYIFAEDRKGTIRNATEDGHGIQLGLGRRLSDKWNLEFKAYANEIDYHESQADDEINKLGLGVDVQRFFTRDAGFAPYIALGLNGERTQYWNGTEYVNRSYPTADLALGFDSEITDGGTAVRAEARYRLDAYDQAAPGVTEFDDLLVSLGLRIPFGDKAQPEEPIVEAEPVVVAEGPKDSDNDGVLDNSDQCPNTAPGVVVDITGCELKPITVEVDTPAVPDSTVVYFGLDSAILTDAEAAKLEAVIDVMLSRNYLVGVSAGHASSEGAEDYNMRLSRARAEAVKSYMISQGVRGANIIAKGHGENEPAATNSNESGRELNRRVEVRLLDQ